MADNSSAPSRTRNFFGRIVDGLLPGSQYNRNTGAYSNIGSGIAGLVGDAIVPGAGTILQGKWENRNAGAPGPMTFEDPAAPNNPGMSVSNIGQPAIGGIGALQGGHMGGGYGPSAFSTSGYFAANPNPPSQSPGGFSNGIFNGGSGNFGPAPGPIGGLSGGGGPRSNFGGYANQAHMDASIAATQDGLKQSRSGSTNVRQTGGNTRGHLYGQ